MNYKPFKQSSLFWSQFTAWWKEAQWFAFHSFIRWKNSKIQCLTFFVFISFAGGTVSEEKPKDAGHFDPLRHSHGSNCYTFWNKVLIVPSSGFCFLCGCLLCICVDLDLLSVLLKTKLTAFPFIPSRKRQEDFLVPLTGALWAVWR